MTVSVLIADDEPIVRQGVRNILEHAKGITVVGEAATGREAIAAARSARMDLVLMDLRMPEVDGIAATREVSRLGVKVLVLTTYDLDENLYRSFQAGAAGFVLKTALPEDLVHAVRVVARGDSLVEPRVVRRLIERHLVDTAPRPPAPWVERLSRREHEVLGLLITGRSNAEISADLFVSQGTIKSHVASILSKMGVRDRLQAVIAAYEAGYAEPSH